MGFPTKEKLQQMEQESTTRWEEELKLHQHAPGSSQVAKLLKEQGRSIDELPMFQTPSSLGWK